MVWLREWVRRRRLEFKLGMAIVEAWATACSELENYIEGADAEDRVTNMLLVKLECLGFFYHCASRLLLLRFGVEKTDRIRRELILPLVNCLVGMSLRDGTSSAV